MEVIRKRLLPHKKYRSPSRQNQLSTCWWTLRTSFSTALCNTVYSSLSWRLLLKQVLENSKRVTHSDSMEGRRSCWVKWVSFHGCAGQWSASSTSVQERCNWYFCRTEKAMGTGSLLRKLSLLLCTYRFTQGWERNSFSAMASGWIIILHSPFERLIFVSCGRVRVRRELMIFRYEWEKLPPGSIHCLYP